MLLDRNANVSLKSDDGRTALGAAAREGYVDIARMLLDIGHANVNQPSEEDNTPLMLAAMNGEQGMVDLLLEHHAIIVGLYNDDKEDAEEVALRHGNFELATYLKAAGLKQRGKGS